MSVRGRRTVPVRKRDQARARGFERVSCRYLWRAKGFADARRQRGSERGSELDRWRRSLISVFLGNISFLGKDQFLLEEIKKHGRILDSYFPPSSSKIRLVKYGFVRFREMREALQVIKEFNGLLWNGRRLKVCLAKPRSKPTLSPPPTVDRNGTNQFTAPPPQNSPSLLPHPNGSSYADVVNLNLHPSTASTLGIKNSVIPNPSLTSNQQTSSNCSNYPPPHSTLPLVLLEENLDTSWLDSCAIAEVLHPAAIPNLEKRILRDNITPLSFSFLGGGMVLLRFLSRKEMLECIEKHGDWLKVFFNHVRPWSLEERTFDQFLWIRIENLPLHAWCLNFFKMFGNHWGTFISVDEDTRTKNNLEKAMVLVLANKDTIFPESQMILVKGEQFVIKITVEKDVDFLRYGAVSSLHCEVFDSDDTSERNSSDECFDFDSLPSSRTPTVHARLLLEHEESFQCPTSPSAHSPREDNLKASFSHECPAREETRGNSFLGDMLAAALVEEGGCVLNRDLINSFENSNLLFQRDFETQLTQPLILEPTLNFGPWAAHTIPLPI